MRLATLVAVLVFTTFARAEAPPPLRVALAAPAGKDEAQLAGYEIEAGLERLLGRPVRAKVAKNYAEAGAMLAKGEADLAWLQPLAYVKVSAETAVRPLVKVVRRGQPFYRSVLFSRADARIATIDALAGRRMGWVEANSSSGYVIPSAMLRQAGVKPSHEAMLDDHASLCRAVWAKKVEAGATFSSDDGRTAEGCVAELEADAQKLAIIAVSPPIPNDVLVARPGLDPELVNRLRESLLALSLKNTDDRQLLRAFAADGFAPSADEDFAPLRKLQQ